MWMYRKNWFHKQFVLLSLFSLYNEKKSNSMWHFFPYRILPCSVIHTLTLCKLWIHDTLHPALSICLVIDQLVPLLLFSLFLSFSSSLLLPKWPGDLVHHCPCPPAGDWGTRISSLVLKENKANISQGVQIISSIKKCFDLEKFSQLDVQN